MAVIIWLPGEIPLMRYTPAAFVSTGPTLPHVTIAPAIGAFVLQLRITPVTLPVAFALLKKTKIDKKAITNDCKDLVKVFI
jgi:hypothetical protein